MDNNTINTLISIVKTNIDDMRRILSSTENILKSLEAYKNDTKSDEEIYRKVLQNYHMQDCERHINDMIEEESNISEQLKTLCENDMRAIVNRFEDKYDCNLTENDQWRYAIAKFVDQEC